MFRGWLKSINNRWLNNQGGLNDDNNDLFGMEFNYTTADAGLNSAAQYNGNIADVRWKSKNSNQTEYAYGYQYDQLNQLSSAKFAYWLDQEGDWSADNKYSLNSISYDLNGNIQTMNQNWNGALADNLTYTYNGNKLIGVEDAVANSAQTNDFEDNGSHYSSSNHEYLYDVNGNMIQDKNKNITVTYNYMNLPTMVNFGGGNKIEWIYSVSGAKLRKNVYTNNALTLTQDYVNGFVYKNSALDFFGMEEGRVKKIANGSLRYEYNISDHLGNTRVTFADTNNDGTADILQEDHYYAFGLRIEGLSSQEKDNKYTYNGKELEDDHGLNWYHYGARYYDPALGRWMAIDPKDEFSSPYLYVANDPLNAIDPDGAGEIKVRSLDAGGLPVTSKDKITHHAQIFLTNTNDYSFDVTFGNNVYKYSNVGIRSTDGLFGTDPSTFFQETDPNILNKYTSIISFDDQVGVQAFNIVRDKYMADGNMPIYDLRALFSDPSDINCQTNIQNFLYEYDKIAGTDKFNEYNRMLPTLNKNLHDNIFTRIWDGYDQLLNMDSWDLIEMVK